MKKVHINHFTPFMTSPFFALQHVCMPRTRKKTQPAGTLFCAARSPCHSKCAVGGLEAVNLWEKRCTYLPILSSLWPGYIILCVSQWWLQRRGESAWLCLEYLVVVTSVIGSCDLPIVAAPACSCYWLT